MRLRLLNQDFNCYNEDERKWERGKNIMGADIRTRRGGKGMKEEHVGGKETENIGSGNGGGAVHKNEGGIWGV